MLATILAPENARDANSLVRRATTGLLRVCRRLLHYKAESSASLLKSLQMVRKLDPEVAWKMAPDIAEEVKHNLYISCTNISHTLYISYHCGFIQPCDHVFLVCVSEVPAAEPTNVTLHFNKNRCTQHATTGHLSEIESSCPSSLRKKACCECQIAEPSEWKLVEFMRHYICCLYRTGPKLCSYNTSWLDTSWRNYSHRLRLASTGLHFTW